MGRPQEVSGELMQEIADQSQAAEENGNGVEHHSPAKSSSYPSQESSATQEARLNENGTIESESLPYDDHPAHENGDTDSSALEDTATVSKEEAPLTPEAKLEAEKRKDRLKRLYIVRLPRPVETHLPQQQVLEDRAKELSEEVSAINRKVDGVKTERDHVRSQRDGAKASLAVCKEQVSAKLAQLEPHRAAVKARREERESFKQASSELEYKSEKELDDAIKAVEFALSHETHPVAEEKKMIARIKKLEAQRPKVRQFAESRPPQPSPEEAAAAKLSQEEVRALEIEMNTLVNERKVQSAIYDQYRTQAEELDKEVSALLDERKKLRIEIDEIYTSLSALKAEARNKGHDWRENRDLSKNVRELISTGRVQQARDLAADQAEKVMKRLAENKAFSKEYFVLWRQQRKYPMFQFEEEQKRLAEASQKQVKPEEWNFDADQVIGAVLDKVSASQADKTKESVPAAPITTSKEEAPESKPESQGGVIVLPQQAQTLGQLQMAMLHESGSAASAKSKGAKKNKADKKRVVEVPAIIDDKTPFVPPAAALKREEAVVDEDEEREKARLRNLEAAREAEARKERKRRMAEKKAGQKARASQAKDAQKAAAAAAKDDDGAKDSAPAAAAQVSDDAGQQSDAVETATTASAAAAPAAAAAAQASTKAASSPTTGSKAAAAGNKPSGRPGIRVAGPVAKIRRRKGTADGILGYIQQQLPKDQNIRILILLLASVAVIWLLSGTARWIAEAF